MGSTLGREDGTQLQHMCTPLGPAWKSSRGRKGGAPEFAWPGEEPAGKEVLWSRRPEVSSLRGPRRRCCLEPWEWPRFPPSAAWGSGQIVPLCSLGGLIFEVGVVGVECGVKGRGGLSGSLTWGGSAPDGLDGERESKDLSFPFPAESCSVFSPHPPALPCTLCGALDFDRSHSLTKP